MISSDVLANTGTDGLVISGNTTEFFSHPGREQFEVICTNQEVTAAVVEGGIFDIVEVWMFFDVQCVHKRLF